MISAYLCSHLMYNPYPKTIQANIGRITHWEYTLPATVIYDLYQSWLMGYNGEYLLWGWGLQFAVVDKPGSKVVMGRAKLINTVWVPCSFNWDINIAEKTFFVVGVAGAGAGYAVFYLASIWVIGRKIKKKTTAAIIRNLMIVLMKAPNLQRLLIQVVH